MSSTLRLAVIMVLLLASVALGFVAYKQKSTAQVAPAIGYLVAAHPLPAGTLARDDDFVVRSTPLVPAGAIRDTPDDRAALRGSLVRRFLDTGVAITAEDVLRPRDRGFLASVLAPDTRAVSIKVDAESGVSGLIWPGDYVDVVLTQVNNKADPARSALSGATVLHNIRIIAIDQDIVQGAKGNKDNRATGIGTHTVSLQLTPQQVKTIAVAEGLGKLSLAVRAAVDTGRTFGCDVAQEIAHQNAIAKQSATVVVYSSGKTKEYSFNRSGAGNTRAAAAGCDVSGQAASQGAALASRQ
jgi:pilus assembly protein CpaB